MASNTIRCTLKSFPNYMFAPWRKYPLTRRNDYLIKSNPRLIHVSAWFAGDPLKIKMPALSPTMSEGTITKWHKKEGDIIKPGDLLCDIQTDKAVVSMDTEEEGVLAKIIKPADTKDVKIGTIIALVVAEGEDWKNVKIPAAETVPSGVEAPGVKAENKQTILHSGTHATKHKYGPAVRNYLDVYGIKAKSISSSGPNGVLLKGDVLKYIAQHQLTPAPKGHEPKVEKKIASEVQDSAPQHQQSQVKEKAPLKLMLDSDEEPYTDIELSNMRKTIAKRLTFSKTTLPHQYAVMDCCIDELQALRANLQKDGVKVSINDFLIKAVAVTLNKLPQVNATWADEAIQLLDNIDISVAVATENGLITPIIFDALHKGIQDISNNMRELAFRARENKLKLHEFQGGSFTISNLGMFGIASFTAIINPPQACILAVGGSRQILDPETMNVKTVMSLTLCSDGRVVDNELAAKFMEVLKEILEKPMTMLSHTPKPDLQKLFAT